MLLKRRQKKSFQIVVADPPWRFGDRLPGESRGAEKNYRVLTTAQIASFPLPPIADDALLFMWRVSSQQEEALEIARAWGFCPKSEIVWLKKTITGKDHFGMGRYLRLSHESCIVGTRGKGKDLIASRSVRSTFSAPVGRHSAKPDAFFELIEQLVGPSVAKLELFARRKRPGWTCLGDEVTT